MNYLFMDINSVLKNVLKKISLSKEEEQDLNKIGNDVAGKVGGVVGGSVAKGTMVKKGMQDIDIFVLFDSEKDTEKLSGILKKAGLRGRIVHGSRNYFQARINGFIAEIVPIVKFQNPEDVKNVADFSLKHVEYIKKKIARKKKLADEIKLAKVFCYANECYGAESYVSGFSGYALELLVIYFGSFLRFLKGIQNKKIIDIEKFFKNEKEIFQELNENKLQSPVVLIDPVYKFRNVCAGLSDETFCKFLKTAKEFLKKQNESFFEKKELDADNLMRDAKKRKAKFLELKFETDRQEGDIAGTKMKKFFKFLAKEIERKGQKILRQEFYYHSGQEAEGYLIIKENKEIEIKGPGINNKEAVKNFRKARKKIYFRKGFAYSREKVDLNEILSHIKSFEQEIGVQFSVLD